MPNTAMKVRTHKEQRPELYCPDARCLWKAVTLDGPKPCPKHMRSATVPESDRCAKCHDNTSWEVQDGAFVSVCCSWGPLRLDHDDD